MEPLLFKTLSQWLEAPWVAQLNVPQIALLIVCGLVAVLVSFYLIQRDKLQFFWHGVFGILAACVGGAFGGHWMWMAFRGSDIFERPELLLLVFEGGFSSLGVYAGAAIAVAVAMRLMRQPFWRYADAFAPGLLLSAGLARLGCLLEGCDFGRVAAGLPWALRYPRGTSAFAYLENLGLVGDYQRVGLPMHPFPLYEALPALIAGALLIRNPATFGTVTGQRAAGCAALYCGFRCIAEYFRADTQILFSGFTLLQALCLAGTLFFGWIWWQRTAHNAANASMLHKEATP